MNKEYNTICKSYTYNIDSSRHRKVEQHSFVKNLPNLRGLNCLDLACGEGLYSRILLQCGAKTVQGVDISEEMVEMAKIKSPKEIEFFCQDVATLGKIGEFDLISGCYLLCYAPDLITLRLFAVMIYQNLKPGGYFIGLNDNPSFDLKYSYKMNKYGFSKRLSTDNKINWAWLGGKSQIYWYSRETYQQIFEEIGFKNFEWFEMEYSGEDRYLNDFLDYPPVVGMKAKI